MSRRTAALDTREQVLREIRAGERFAIVSHEHLDGDALGSLVAMQGILRALGKDSRDRDRAGGVPAAAGVPLLRARRARAPRRPPISTGAR